MIKHKGVLLCLLAVALIASSNVFASGALQYGSYQLVASLWFAVAATWFWGTALLKKQNPVRWIVEHWRAGLLLGFANFISTVTWFYAISIIGPATTGFLQRIHVLVFFGLGFVFLRERVSRWDIVSLLLAVSGAALITFSLERFLWLGALVALVAAASGAIHDFVGQRFVQHVDPFILGTVRATYTLGMLSILAIPALQVPPTAILPWIIVGPMLSAFLGYWTFFISLKNVPVTLVSILLNAHPFFVVALAALLLGTVPTLVQLLGGLLIIVGVLLPMLRKTF